MQKNPPTEGRRLQADLDLDNASGEGVHASDILSDHVHGRHASRRNRSLGRCIFTELLPDKFRNISCKPSLHIPTIPNLATGDLLFAYRYPERYPPRRLVGVGLERCLKLIQHLHCDSHTLLNSQFEAVSVSDELSSGFLSPIMLTTTLLH